MVVQCPNCQARFKLADDKVSAKGVKIRCSKCANVFTVKPEDGVVGSSSAKSAKPPAPDISTAKEPAGAKPGFKDFNFEDFADVSTKSKGGPPPSPPPAKAPPSPKSAPLPKPAARAPAAEVDEDLSDFFSAGDVPVASPKPAARPAPKPPAKPVAPKPAAAPADPFGDLDGTPPTAKAAGPVGGDGLDDLFASAPPPPPQAKSKPVPKAPPPSPPPPAPKPAVPKPALKPPPTPAPEPETDEPDFGGDIELDTSRSGADGFGGVFADAPPPPAAGGKAGGSEDSFDSLIGTSGSAFDDAPPPPPAGGGGGGIELDMASSKTLEFLQRAGETSRKKVVQTEGPNLGLIVGIAAGVFLFLVIGFRAMVEFIPESVPGVSLENARSIREIVPFPVTNPDFPEPAPKIEARVDQTYPVKNLAGEVIYVATGKLVNRSGAPMNFLRVKLRLVDKQGQTLQEKTVFAGNVVSLDRLQKTDPKEIDTEFQRKLGASNSNMNVGNNTTVNFMGIFYQYGGDPASVQIVEATAGN